MAALAWAQASRSLWHQHSPRRPQSNATFRRSFGRSFAHGTRGAPQKTNRHREAFCGAIDRLVAIEDVTAEHVGELALVWRIGDWHGDECVALDANDTIERALWKAIEKLTGMSMTDGQTVTLKRINETA
jgi:hypothetical protein